MNRSRALSALAAIVHEIRTDWDEAGVLAVLQRNPDASLADLAHAAIHAAATRPDQKTPAVIGLAGSHWGGAPSGQPRAHRLPTWHAEEQATPPATAEQIAACRARISQSLAD